MYREICLTALAIAAWSGAFLLAKDAACGYPYAGTQWLGHADIPWTSAAASPSRSLRGKSLLLPEELGLRPSLPAHLPENEPGAELPRQTEPQKLFRVFQ